MVSDRAKAVLEALDPNAFAFVKLDVRLPGGEPGPIHWFCDVLPIIVAVNEEASKIKIEFEQGMKIYNLMGGANLVFKEDVIGEHHIFRPVHMEATIICDDQLRQSCKSAGLKGITFRDAADTNRRA